MNIAVIADTHGTLPAGEAESLRTADEIWHLGDFCDLATLDGIRRLGPPVFAVLGNNDVGLDLPVWLLLDRNGIKFRLIHIPPRRPAGADVLIHGHTHVPRDEMVGSVRVLNPGTIGKPNKGAPRSRAWLRIKPDGTFSWEIVPVARLR